MIFFLEMLNENTFRKRKCTTHEKQKSVNENDYQNDDTPSSFYS